MNWAVLFAVLAIALMISNDTDEPTCVPSAINGLSGEQVTAFTEEGWVLAYAPDGTPQLWPQECLDRD